MRAVFVALCLGSSLLSCSPAKADSAGNTLRFVPHADVAIIDPHWSLVAITRNYGYMVYDTLFAMDAEFRPQPQMVDAWQASDDKLTYTFTLRDGLKFHDGQPVRAADVVASLKRWGQRNVAYGQSLLAAAAVMEAIDDKHFRIALKKPFPVLEALGTLTAPIPFIMPERLAKTDAYTQIKEAIGSGPFKFVTSERQPGHKAVFVKNPDYVPRSEPPNGMAGGKVVRIDRVEWIYIPEQITQVQALLAGEVDYLEGVQNDLLPMLEHDANITVGAYPGGGLVGAVRFNHLHPPFNNVKMRQAVLAVADQREYLAAMAGDQDNWQTCFSFYACLGASADEKGGDALSGARDYEKAKRLIAESGYKGERIVVLDPADLAVNHAEALITDALLRRLGLNVELATSEWGTVSKRLTMREPVEQGGWSIINAALASFEMISPATNRYLRTNGTSAAPGWPSDDEMEKLREAWLAATNDTQRRDLADQMQRRAFEIVPYIPTGQFQVRTAYRNNIVGRVDAPIPVLWNIAKQQ